MKIFLTIMHIYIYISRTRTFKRLSIASKLSVTNWINILIKQSNFVLKLKFLLKKNF